VGEGAAMPIYKYRCYSSTDPDHSNDPYTGARPPACKHEFEVLYTSFGAVAREESSEKCPQCGGTKKERLLNPEGVSHQFTGGKWYREGY